MYIEATVSFGYLQSFKKATKVSARFCLKLSVVPKQISLSSGAHLDSKKNIKSFRGSQFQESSISTKPSFLSFLVKKSRTTCCERNEFRWKFEQEKFFSWHSCQESENSVGSQNWEWRIYEGVRLLRALRKALAFLVKDKNYFFLVSTRNRIAVLFFGPCSEQ